MTELELERALADLAGHLEQPPTPPLAEAVVARIADRPAPARRLGPSGPRPVRARGPVPAVPWMRLPRRGWRRVAV
ncbi:MAG TPA: hypothetical protein VFA46_03645, partial [Actinomycetes bacterium]|nr:hypothetical protein [Actinomycetes bacterium]